MATIATVPYTDWPDTTKQAASSTTDGVAGWGGRGGVGGRVFTVRKITMASTIEPIAPTDVGLPAGSQIGKVYVFPASRGVRWNQKRQALTTEQNPNLSASVQGQALDAWSTPPSMRDVIVTFVAAGW